MSHLTLPNGDTLSQLFQGIYCQMRRLAEVTLGSTTHHFPSIVARKELFKACIILLGGSSKRNQSASWSKFTLKTRYVVLEFVTGRRS